MEVERHLLLLSTVCQVLSPRHSLAEKTLKRTVIGAIKGMLLRKRGDKRGITGEDNKTLREHPKHRL